MVLPSREQLEAWDREHVWHPFTPMQIYADETPLIIERAEGNLLYDLDGRAYIDGISSLWCNVHGHRAAELDAALHAQIDRLAHSTLLGIGNVPSIQLARRLVELAPPGLNRVFYSDNGATAVEVALKMAFQYWRQCSTPRPEKSLYLSVQGAYHGDTLGDVSVGDIGRFHELFKPLLFPTVRSPGHYCYRCPLGLERSNCGIACAGELERLVEQHADQLAAVVLEPIVQGAAGMITAPDGFLRRVREVTAKHNVLLIADEVAVGFGRTGTLFACEHEGVIPDFLCVAKGITGGYLPLAATLTNDRIYAAFLGQPEEGRTFFHGHTYAGNPLGCAVALANLQQLIEGGVLAGTNEREAILRHQMNQIASLSIVGEVRQRGLMVGIELVADRTTKTPFPPGMRMGQKVCARAREQGVLIRPLRDVVVVMPPLAIEIPLLEQLGEVVYEAIAASAGPNSGST